MSKIGIIIKREFLTRVKKKSFIIMTFLGPLLFLGFLIAAGYISQTDSKTFNVLLTDQEGMFGKVIFKDEFKDSGKAKFFHNTNRIPLSEFKESNYDLMIDLQPEMITAGSVDMFYNTYPSFRVQRHISNQLEGSFQKSNLAQNDVSLELYKKLEVNINLNAVDVDKIAEDGTKKPSIDPEVGYGVGIFFSVIIFMFILLYGQLIMRGVLEEKTSRIVEVIVSSVKPFHLMMGKIIGVALVGLTQFIMWIAFSSVLFMAAGLFFPDVFMDPSALMEQQMTPEIQDKLLSEMGGVDDLSKNIYNYYHQINFPFILAMFIFYFLGGYLLYGSLYAAIGAAVEAETDSQQFMVPLIMPLMLGYFIAIGGLTNPQGSAMFWGSLIPFTSPIVMLTKVGAMGMGIEPIDWPLILSSMGLLILAFIFTVWLAGKIYRAGILFHGKKVGYKDIWKWIRYGA